MGGGDETAAARRARALLAGAVVIDGLNTSPVTWEQYKRFRAGGVTAVNLTASPVDLDLDRTLSDLARIVGQVAALQDCYLLVTDVRDIHAAKASGRVGVILGLQNAKPLDDRLERVWVLHALGVRIMQLTYNERNCIGDGCTEPTDAGLSRFGVAVVREMNRIGMLVDLSHCGVRTTRDAIDVSEQPVAITHANPSAIVPNPRNKPDDVLCALAQRGGMLGLCPWSPINAAPEGGRPTLDDWLSMIDYAVDLMGVDHVGIGTDHSADSATKEEWERLFGRSGRYPEVTGHLGSWFGFETRFVDGFQSIDRLGRVPEELLRRGYAEADVRGILGENFLRLFSSVWPGRT
ncbi:MAG TPA: membrane dipeptidase [bacterium]|nr:membrane dipeptidase [bacterium]